MTFNINSKLSSSLKRLIDFGGLSSFTNLTSHPAIEEAHPIMRGPII